MKSTITFKNPKMKKAFETPGEWIGIVNQRTSIVKEDKIAIRINKIKDVNENPIGSQISITIGKTIAELLKWTGETRVSIYRSAIRPNLLKLEVEKTGGGYKLSTTKFAPGKVYLKIRVNDKELKSDITFNVEYEIENDYLLIDLSQFMI